MYVNVDGCHNYRLPRPQEPCCPHSLFIPLLVKLHMQFRGGGSIGHPEWLSIAGAVVIGSLSWTHLVHFLLFYAFWHCICLGSAELWGYPDRDFYGEKAFVLYNSTNSQSSVDYHSVCFGLVALAQGVFDAEHCASFPILYLSISSVFSFPISIYSALFSSFAFFSNSQFHFFFTLYSSLLAFLPLLLLPSSLFPILSFCFPFLLLCNISSPFHFSCIRYTYRQQEG